MSGECEVCGNHTLECICNQTQDYLRERLFPDQTSLTTPKPLIVSTDMNIFLSLCARSASVEEFANHGWSKVCAKQNDPLKESE